MVAEIVRLDTNCGICSYAWMHMNAVYKMWQYGRDSVINMRDNFYPQFHDFDTFGKVNVWEDYFKQPHGIDLNGLQKIEHEIYSYYGTNELDNSDECMKREFSGVVLRPSNEVSDKIEECISNINIDSTIGVLFRGSDYRSIRPRNHPVQPNENDVLLDLNEASENLSINSVFIVTDDRKFLERVRNETKMNVLSIQTEFIDNRGNMMNSEFMKTMDYTNKRKLNVQYISSVFILSKLKYNILSNTSALNVYDYLRKNTFIPSYEKRYDLGVY